MRTAAGETPAGAPAAADRAASARCRRQDKLIDLLYNAEHPKAERPTLDVKKDTKGWVTVANATTREVPNLKEMTELEQEGLARRRVAHTQMNTESSRWAGPTAPMRPVGVICPIGPMRPIGLICPIGPCALYVGRGA